MSFMTLQSGSNLALASSNFFFSSSSSANSSPSNFKPTPTSSRHTPSTAARNTHLSAPSYKSPTINQILIFRIFVHFLFNSHFLLHLLKISWLIFQTHFIIFYFSSNLVFLSFSFQFFVPIAFPNSTYNLIFLPI